MRAIDLYSGVGGWSLGLAMAGIEVVASYERWEAANQTNALNNRHDTHKTDIRELNPASLPRDVDLVVGSPPCTQFSYSNRGGGGDISDGLKDIQKFLDVVDFIKPRYWVMENVPRVAEILKKEFQSGGRLEKYRHLDAEIHVVNMEDYGLPQRRKRCFAGNIPFDLLLSYPGVLPRKTLGDVVRGLKNSPLIDPIYGHTISVDEFTDHTAEPVLNAEETRINRASKILHTVYNKMAFPDQIDRASRTVTATCTRVSRESIVIATSNPNEYRRLTLRERASCQGFPINFQFFGSTFGQKQKMIGNAVPPLFSLLIGHACQGMAAENLPPLEQCATAFRSPDQTTTITHSELPGRRYPWDRTFRFAIPSLRLKSGVRFELLNCFEHDHPGWKIMFVYGHSKSIQNLELDNETLEVIPETIFTYDVSLALSDLETFIRTADIKRMQDVWSHRGPGATRPFDFMDEIDKAAERLVLELMTADANVLEAALREVITAQAGPEGESLPGTAKLFKHAALIVAGLLIGSTVNKALKPDSNLPYKFVELSATVG